MNILLTNDDGYQASGIRLLHSVLSQKHKVVVVAPERNRSATSNALTLDMPLRPHRSEDGFIYVEHGTPTDCVHIALTGLLDFVPDMVVSGINAGANLGDDTLYSGTVAAAMEGRFLGYPSIAISAVAPFNFETAASVTEAIIWQLEHHPLPEEILLNINVPGGSKPCKGIKVARLGRRHPSDALIKSTDPQGRDVYWLGGSGKASDAGSDTDFGAIESGYASLTPLTSDLTKHASLERLRQWL